MENDYSKEAFDNLMKIANKIEASYLTEANEERRMNNFILDSPVNDDPAGINIINEETVSERIDQMNKNMPIYSIKKNKKPRPQS